MVLQHVLTPLGRFLAMGSDRRAVNNSIGVYDRSTQLLERVPNYGTDFVTC